MLAVSPLPGTPQNGGSKVAQKLQSKGLVRGGTRKASEEHSSIHDRESQL